MMELLVVEIMKGSLCYRIIATGLCFSCYRIKTMLQVHFLLLQVWTSHCKFELRCCKFVFVVIPCWPERIPRWCRIITVYFYKFISYCCRFVSIVAGSFLVVAGSLQEILSRCCRITIGLFKWILWENHVEYWKLKIWVLFIVPLVR